MAKTEKPIIQQVADFARRRKTGVTCADVQDRFGVIPQRASNMLADLVKRGTLTRSGDRGSFRYTAATQEATASA